MYKSRPFLPLNVAHAYKQHHDRVLQLIMSKFLLKNSTITDLPSWCTQICIKSLYQNDEFEVYWDIPEYDRELKNGPLQPNGKIINKTTKTIFVLEM